MFKELRRKERLMEEEKMESILHNALYGVMSVNGEYAYGVPLCFVYNGSDLYFHMAKEGYKTDLFKENNKVSFVIVESVANLPEAFSMVYESVMVFGEIIEVEGIEKKNILEMFVKKYAKERLKDGLEYIEKAWEQTKVVTMKIKHKTGKLRKNPS